MIAIVAAGQIKPNCYSSACEIPRKYQDLGQGMEKSEIWSLSPHEKLEENHTAYQIRIQDYGKMRSS